MLSAGGTLCDDCVASDGCLRQINGRLRVAWTPPTIDMHQSYVPRHFVSVSLAVWGACNHLVAWATLSIVPYLVHILEHRIGLSTIAQLVSHRITEYE